MKGAQGLALDSNGNIYFGDIEGQRIRKITISTGLISTVAGTGTLGYNGDGIAATSANLYYPSALNFDKNGDLYFTDRANCRIRKVTMSTGLISTVAGTGTCGYNGDGIAATAAQLNFPNDVSFDAAGNMYIADWPNNRVRKVDKSTGIISTIAGTGTGGYNGDGIAATAAQINGPCGIIFDNAGNIYFAEYNGARVRKIDISTGLISTYAGTGTPGYNGDGIAATSANLSGCAYIKFDSSWNMYIGDGNNHRIRLINRSTGLISTIAGTGTSGYNGDGISATSAQLNAPFSVYPNQYNCDIYIGDYYNNRIRKITGGFAGCSPAVAPGNKTSCQSLVSVMIDNTNNNSWVPVYDTAGRIAVAINANGNNLGVVNVSLFTKNGACREDFAHRLYLNRNLTISPQNQPASGNVSLRFYIQKAELDSIKTAKNSLGQPSGVATINDIEVFKNNDACAATGSITALPLTTSSGTYNSDYYLQANVTGFSSFYFANKLLAAILPAKIISFSGERLAGGNLLKWKASCNGNALFIIERSNDGVHFNSIDQVNAVDCNADFTYIDKNYLVENNFYRVTMVENGMIVNISTVVSIAPDDKVFQIRVSPSTINKRLAQLIVTSGSAGNIQLNITDVSGRIITRTIVSVKSGINKLSIGLPVLAGGLYWILGTATTGNHAVASFLYQ